MDKVVVIGGSGFIGSHVADLLSENGYEVVIYDVVESSWLRHDQKMVVGDALDSNKLLKVLDGARYLFHFAGIADIGESRERPFDTVNLNILGATIAAQVAVEAKVERFIYASTMYVYSGHGSFYRASKQSAEIIIETYHKEFGIDYTFLRYGSLYGPRSQKWNGLRRYVEQVVKEGRLSYRGTGNEQREYIHVKDAAKLSVSVLDKAHENQAITVTGHQVLRSNEMIDMIFEIANKEKDIVYINAGTEHYEMTPYQYTPKMAKKIVPTEFIDIGQGILDLVEEAYHG